MAKASNGSERNEIIWNIINSLIAGLLVLFGSLTTIFSTGDFTSRSLSISISVALLTALTVAFSKFRDYWLTQEGEYSNSKITHLFNFY